MTLYRITTNETGYLSDLYDLDEAVPAKRELERDGFTGVSIVAYSVDGRDPS